MQNTKILAITAAMLTSLSQAHADLVYDADPVVVQQQPVQVVAQPQVLQAAPQVLQAAPTEQLTRSELIRRERIRKEMQAEDVLSARMESLRLRDEDRRVQELIKADTQGTVVAGIPAQQMIVTSQASPVAVSAAPAQISVSPVTAIGEVAPSEDEFRVAISPRGGIANIALNNQNFGYGNYYPMDVVPYYAFGGNLSGYSGRFAFDLGYTYSLYGISMPSQLSPVFALQNQYSQFRNNALESKQHLFEAGMRFFITPSSSKFRPFAGGGVAYGRSLINYSQGIQSTLAQYGMQMYGLDYLLEQYLASITAGVELKLGNSFSVGFTGKYSFVLNARQTQPVYQFYGTPIQDLDKMAVANSIAQAGFYSFQLGLNLFL
ncbi:MAG: hypothetical protein KA715_08440 [Xanthomonadaceae bacterium]|nr:hypothetical protein [Xanthomonadaceae bacterium]